jgi:predicted nicotinamide N-methyase
VARGNLGAAAEEEIAARDGGTRAAADPARFVSDNTLLAPVPNVAGIRLHLAHQGSGLGRLAEGASGRAAAPYWAYAWPGGVALAHHVLAHPAIVAGRRVLDIGSGSGLVAIAAAKAGAASVTAAEIDPFGRAAIALNVAANDVVVRAIWEDVTGGPVPAVDLVLAGDVYFDAAVGKRMTAFFERCVGAGIAVVIGDPGRAHLPADRLTLLAEYAAGDVGGAANGEAGTASVFTYGAAG